MAIVNYVTKLRVIIVFFTLCIPSIAREFPEPTNVQANVHLGQIVLTWDIPINTSQEVKSYIISISENEKPQPIFITIASNNRCYIVPKEHATDEKEYTFYIQAEYANGTYSNWSNVAWIPMNSGSDIYANQRNTLRVQIDSITSVPPSCINLQDTSRSKETENPEFFSSHNIIIIGLAGSSATLFLSSAILLIIVIRLKKRSLKEVHHRRYETTRRDANTQSTHSYDTPAVHDYMDI